jgi:hypothetical protein
VNDSPWDGSCSTTRIVLSREAVVRKPSSPGADTLTVTIDIPPES